MGSRVESKRVWALASATVLVASAVASPASAAGTWTAAPSNQVNNGPAFGKPISTFRISSPMAKVALPPPRDANFRRE